MAEDRRIDPCHLLQILPIKNVEKQVGWLLFTSSITTVSMWKCLLIVGTVSLYNIVRSSPY